MCVCMCVCVCVCMKACSNHQHRCSEWCLKSWSRSVFIRETCSCFSMSSLHPPLREQCYFLAWRLTSNECQVATKVNTSVLPTCSHLLSYYYEHNTIVNTGKQPFQFSFSFPSPAASSLLTGFQLSCQFHFHTCYPIVRSPTLFWVLTLRLKVKVY